VGSGLQPEPGQPGGGTTSSFRESVTKRYDEPIEVRVDPLDSGTPISFRWRGRLYEIDQPLSSWREAGEWRGLDVRELEYYRVLARPPGALATGDVDADGFMQSVSAVFDLYRDRLGGTWHLSRLWD
jgi:Family of unknown function (DUF6504)